MSECPGLVGPSELARWKVLVDFAEHKVGVDGKWAPTVMSASRHPLLNLLEVEGKQDPKLWETPQLQDLRVRRSLR